MLQQVTSPQTMPMAKMKPKGGGVLSKAKAVLVKYFLRPVSRISHLINLGNHGMTSTPAQQVTKTSPEPTMTKKQRQNAKKREMLKAAKAEAEATRLEGLAKHNRELERERIIELSRSGGGKRLGGGMQAIVDDKGKLVWD